MKQQKINLRLKRLAPVTNKWCVKVFKSETLTYPRQKSLLKVVKKSVNGIERDKFALSSHQ